MHRRGWKETKWNALSIRALLLLPMLFGATILIQAQGRISMTLNVAARPSPYVSDWSSRKENASITVITGPGTRAQQARFKGELYVDDKLLARTKQNDMPVITLPAGPGSQVYFAESMFPHRAIEFIGGIDANVVKTGMLPAGSYRLCIELVSLDGRTQLAENAPACAQFVLTDYEPPTLLIPENNAQVNPAERPTFRWTPVTPQPPGAVRYTVSFFERIEGQPLSQVLKQKPLYEKDVVGMTQLPWPPEFTLPARVKQVVWTVRGFDDKRAPLGARQGYAEPFIFTPPAQDGAAVARVTSNCAPSGFQAEQPSTTPGTLSDYTNLEVKIGLFSMRILTAGPALSGEGLDGTGTIKIDFLLAPFQVSFKNIKINSDNIVYAGSAHGVLEQPTTVSDVLTNWGVENIDPSAWTWTPEGVNDVLAWLNNPEQGGRVVTIGDQILQGAVTLPFGFRNSVAGFTLAVCALNFTHIEASAAVAFSFPVTEGIEGTEVKNLAFKATGIPIAPSGPSASGRIELIADADISWHVPGGSDDEHKCTFTFKSATTGGSGSDAGTWVEWDCEGFSQAHIDVDYSFPRVWLKPVPDNNQRSTVTIRTYIENWDKWMCNELTLPRSEIVGSGGMQIEILNAAYDHSIIENPDSPVWGILTGEPFNLTVDNGFQGFVLASASVYLPEGIKSYTNAAEPLKLSLQNVVIGGNYGLTGLIAVSNLPEFEDAYIGGFSGSIDNINAKFLYSSLEECRIDGKILLPFCAPMQGSGSNELDYEITWQSGSTAISGVVKPATDAPITAQFFHNATLTIADNSNLSFTLGNTVDFELTLNGSLSWNGITIGGNTYTLGLTAGFEGMKLKRENGGVTYEVGNWDFGSSSNSSSGGPGQGGLGSGMSVGKQIGGAQGINSPPGGGTSIESTSPVHKFAGFPISLTDVQFDPVTSTDPDVKLNGKLKLIFAVNLDVSDANIDGSTTLSLPMWLTDEVVPGSSLTRMQPHIGDVTLDAIQVNLNTAAVEVNGSLVLFSDDGKWGNGFRAELAAKIKPLYDLELQAAVQFGSTRYAGDGVQPEEEPYRYWYVSLSGNSNVPLLTIPTSFGIYGAGVGVWRGVSVEVCPDASAAQSDNATASPLDAASPSKNVGLGFRANAVLGTIPVKPFTCDVCIGAEFYDDGGISVIKVTGTGYVQGGLSPEERANSLVVATVVGKVKFFDNECKVEHMWIKSTVQLKVPPGSGSILQTPLNDPLRFKVMLSRDDPESQWQWYAKFGGPKNPEESGVDEFSTPNEVIILSIVNAWMYLQFGNSIDPFPAEFQPAAKLAINDILGPNTKTPNILNLSQNESQIQSGSGFMTGLGANVSIAAEKDFTAFKLRSSFDAGFEMGLAMMMLDAHPCNASDVEYGWGADHWYCRGKFAVWLKAAIEGKVPGGNWAEVLSIKGLGYFNGGFPNPTWFKGKLAGSLNCFIRASFTLPFSYGDDCPSTGSGGEEDDPSDSWETTSTDNPLIISGVSPANNAIGVPISGSMLEVSLNCADGQSYQIEESPGKIKTYRCKVMWATLEKISLPSSPPITLNNPITNTDNLLLYTLPSLEPCTIYKVTIKAELQQGPPSVADWMTPTGPSWNQTVVVQFKTSGCKYRELMPVLPSKPQIFQ